MPHIWTIEDKGFLPSQDPVEKLSKLWNPVEKLVEEMPNLLESRHWRSEVVARLRATKLHLHNAHIKEFDKYGDEDDFRLERGMLIYSYFASAWVWANYEEPANFIPPEISFPLVKLAELTNRLPILSYASYCLTNWKKINKNNDPVLGNIELLQNFTATNKQDEDWFILVHVEIEWHARHAIEAIKNWNEEGSDAEAEAALSQVHVSIANMNATMNRMPEGCSADSYFNRVRPYIFGFNNVVYEGHYDEKPQSFRGETGAQSSIVPSLIAFFGVTHKDNALMQHLQDMRLYMPSPHKIWVGELEKKNNIREFVKNHTQLKEIYNACLNELYKFRSKHLEYAVNYIQKKVENPTGTGGTPYIPWLSQLKEETKEQML